ncbi:MAG TPA: hypothetical protein VG709_05695, partial [Actinomycetota bacterium]|nr:hypothetical protein [Actinomycetota bacterium]
VILALVGGAPVVAARYLPKTGGVMAGVGLERFVVEMNGYRHEQGVDLVKSAPTEQRTVPEKLARLRAQQDEELRTFLSGGRRPNDRSTATAC